MLCGDKTIDGLLAADTLVPPLTPGGNPTAIGYLHDLLRGHGYNSLPDPRASNWKVFGGQTRAAVADYCHRNGLPTASTVDSRLLRDIVNRPAPDAMVGPAYIPLVLDTAFTPIVRFVWLTSLFETGGGLATLNLNTDQCGVSFGILQWSQKPGQLHTFLQACFRREPAEWARIIGGKELLDYTAKPLGGVDALGHALDPRFELTKDPWKSKLRELGASLPIQRLQIDLASETYSAELVRQGLYAPGISQRWAAFLLDLANQFGGGRVEQQYKLAVESGGFGNEVLKKLQDAFTAIARPQFRPQVLARREFFRTTALLSDQPLTEPENRSPA